MRYFYELLINIYCVENKSAVNVVYCFSSKFLKYLKNTIEYIHRCNNPYMNWIWILHDYYFTIKKTTTKNKLCKTNIQNSPFTLNQ